MGWKNGGIRVDDDEPRERKSFLCFYVLEE
jgi:hypothetical protein